jgi:hypothetical protein
VTNDSEVIMKQPSYVPTGWLVAIIGASATAIGLALACGVAWASLSARVSAAEGEVAKYSDMGERIVRVETILVYTFPDQTVKADRMLASQKKNR